MSTSTPKISIWAALLSMLFAACFSIVALATTFTSMIPAIWVNPLSFAPSLLLAWSYLVDADASTMRGREPASRGEQRGRNRDGAAAEPDLVLLDMHLPDMTGFDVLNALRGDSRTENLLMVAVSASAMEADMAKAFELVARDYWTNPLRLGTFLAGVSAQLGLTGSASSTDPARTRAVATATSRNRDF